MQTIRPYGFDICQFRKVLGQSCLQDKCQFIYASDNVLQLIEEFCQLMDREDIAFGAEPLAALQVAGMMLYMLHHQDLPSTQVNRTLFVQRCFDYMACTEQTHVHDLCAQIFLLLDINEPEIMLNMTTCCRNASTLSSMAQIVCSCLLWAMLDKLTDLGFESYRLRAYPELMMAIALVNPLAYLQNYLHSLNLIVRVIAALLVAGPYGSTEKLRNEMGMPQEMFEFPNEDASVLFRWLNAIIEELGYELQVMDGHMAERMVILETTCELMKLVHGHLSEFYQSLHSIADYIDDGFISDHQNEEDFQWLL